VTKTIPLAEAKKSLSAVIKDVDEKFDAFAITKNGVLIRKSPVFLPCHFPVPHR
jgi:hypothetical protein